MGAADWGVMWIADKGGMGKADRGGMWSADWGPMGTSDWRTITWQGVLQQERHRQYGGATSVPQFHGVMYVKFVEIT